eukprot:277115-Hanusia_phi.AAC.1
MAVLVLTSACLKQDRGCDCERKTSRLSVFSVDCMFQIAAHDKSQVNLSRGFALLCTWTGGSPDRGRSGETIMQLYRVSSEITTNGQQLEHASSSIQGGRIPDCCSARGNGRLFLNKVLQSMKLADRALDLDSFIQKSLPACGH